MIGAFFAALASQAAPAATPARCSYATLPAAEQKKYGSRYRFRLRTKGKAEAEEWLRYWACPSEADQARRSAAKARGPIGKDGKPCPKTRTEMRAVTSMDGSMTMIPKQVCAK